MSEARSCRFFWAWLRRRPSSGWRAGPERNGADPFGQCAFFSTLQSGQDTVIDVRADAWCFPTAGRMV
ncbi:MAG: hypothetical protein D6806_03170 [Deltaproteobacteria bacterium]|nr:MAG: hypothetical protein D6806_03170 [Deltaproteobacteria bacterium]